MSVASSIPDIDIERRGIPVPHATGFDKVDVNEDDNASSLPGSEILERDSDKPQNEGGAGRRHARDGTISSSLPDNEDEDDETRPQEVISQASSFPRQQYSTKTTSVKSSFYQAPTTADEGLSEFNQIASLIQSERSSQFHFSLDQQKDEEDITAMEPLLEENIWQTLLEEKDNFDQLRARSNLFYEHLLKQFVPPATTFNSFMRLIEERQRRHQGPQYTQFRNELKSVHKSYLDEMQKRSKLVAQRILEHCEIYSSLSSNISPQDNEKNLARAIKLLQRKCEYLQTSTETSKKNSSSHIRDISNFEEKLEAINTEILHERKQSNEVVYTIPALSVL